MREPFVESLDGVPEATKLECVVGAAAVTSVLASIALKGRASNIAFCAGAAVFAPIAHRMYQREEAYHQANPQIRQPEVG